MSNEIVKPVAGSLAAALPAAPSFLTQDGQLGTEVLQTKLRPPFARIVQKQAADELLSKFGMGAMILAPDNTLILAPGAAPVRIVPIFFYLEYLKLAPIALKDVEPYVADKSFDAGSEIARRCSKKELWMQDHPNHPGDKDYQYRYCEALNFACMFAEPHLQTGMPFVLSFLKGSYSVGQKFCNLVNMRQVSLFGCIFELSVDPTIQSNAKGEWRVPLLANPPDGPWVEKSEEYDLYKSLHFKLKEAHASRQLDTAYADENENESTIPADLPY